MQNLTKNLHKSRVGPDLIKSLPESAGIYVFFKNETPIYIGKAINLKRRVSSYFDIHLEHKTSRMMSEANYFSYIQVTSELEALLLEADLIRRYLPQYNIAAKDDKHPLYILITKEYYPRVITGRKINSNIHKNKAVYGPFPSSSSVRSVLKMIRKIFPFSDHKLGKRACIYSHIGLCNPCPSDIEKYDTQDQKIAGRNKYLDNIRHIKAVLDGKLLLVHKELEREMLTFSRAQDYENASWVRDRIKRLEYITQPQIPTEYFMENPNLYEDIRNREIKDLQKIIERWKIKTGKLHRIECFDIAHLAGTNPTASMVTFSDGESDKKFYRHFKIRQVKGGSDVDSMKEVIRRRKKHLKDWGRPGLIIVDGGKAQVGVFIRELEEEAIPVVGLAKRFETLVIPERIGSTVKLKEFRLPKGPALYLVQRIRNEAHRFARRYHHKLIAKELISNV